MIYSRFVFSFVRSCMLSFMLSVIATLMWIQPATAQTFPTKPLRIIVPFGAGGVADLTARTVAQKMSESLGQPVVIDNKPGAGGVVAGDAVAKAEPDGHTLLLMSNGTAVSAGLFKSLPFDTLRDFAPVSTLGFFDIALITPGHDQHRQHAKPGRRAVQGHGRR
jgi:tripartite-type tricarboxylate transporter receptor subunit TctC